MWEQYKKTFAGMQIAIWLVACAVLLWSHVLALALVFLVTMQLGAVIGALWGYRLKSKVERGATTLR
jgi:hypothetical protein